MLIQLKFFCMFFSKNNIDGRTDGGWSPWSAWSACPRTCSRSGGGAVVQRYRQCNMPSPMFGGSQCQGRSREETIACFDNCPSKIIFPNRQVT